MSTSEFTKYMISKGVKQLLQTTDFENLSVGEIAKHCHISRNTFYYHFKDKYDIISWIFYSEITPIIGEAQSIDNWSEGLLHLCQYMQKNREFYIKVLHVQGQNSFSECLMEFYANLVRNILLNAKGDQMLTPEQIRTISNFYAFGLTGVISNWAKNGMKAEPEPVIQMMEDLLSGEIFDKLLSIQKETNQKNMHS
ncbi:MAG: TetR/AcrR family transcriptional regulator C-terminal domain-containing protein [Massiliimalia sp.]|jgi:probable dihydroxyacetone kinase regulator